MLGCVLVVLAALAYTRPELWPWWYAAAICSVVTVTYLALTGGTMLAKLSALWAKIPRPIVHAIYALAAGLVATLAADLDGLRGVAGGKLAAVIAAGVAVLRAIETSLTKEG